MRWHIVDRVGHDLCEPLPDLAAVRMVIGLYPAWYVVGVSDAEPGRVVEMLMLRRAM